MIELSTSGQRLPQALGITEITEDFFDVQSIQIAQIAVRADHDADLDPALQEAPCDSSADKARRSGHKRFHKI